ncbi:endonuclease/exonuclease/phosphatase family protein [Actinoplanes sp. LDG1-06]|uniref:Endonuclease/exonuclease/phosphatase family protein n=1 Tax=Paractinoplanes ovalisporus TaxID=2810368 RepID=A0ABS2AIJ4_9ACTN|nr:endonuclease/exonuclease/phosphatase family protein [Actinoplanes ovalisporus]MBM2619665.1 endonuclease/exonuclease/phosphatase family protein [Actinoplanes ovalisporus]
MVFSLASVNLHCGLDHRGRPFGVKEAIAALDTDVVLVQENWSRTDGGSLAERAAADCGYTAYEEIALTDVVRLADLEISRGEVPDETGTWGLALMSRLPIDARATIGIGAAPRDVVGERSAQVAEISGVRLVNVHLTHRVLHGPRQLRRLVAGLAGREMPTVVAGDLNMFRPTVYFGRPYRPVVRGRTFPATRPLLQLDHVLAGPGVRVVRAEVLPSCGSDHRPVRVELGQTQGSDHRPVRVEIA